MKIIEGADCVWHLAAAVGPYHPEEVYVKVNRLSPRALLMTALLKEHRAQTQTNE